MASIVNINKQSSTGSLVITQPGAPNETWNLTFLEVSFSVPTTSFGAQGMLIIYDGPVGGPVLFADFLTSPTPGTSSVQKINIPTDAHGHADLRGTPGNAMTIVVDGFDYYTGSGPGSGSGSGVGNQCSVNARFSDGMIA